MASEIIQMFILTLLWAFTFKISIQGKNHTLSSHMSHKIVYFVFMYYTMAFIPLYLAIINPQL